MARLIHKQGSAGAIGAGGTHIEPGEDGVFEVPDALVETLKAHGFETEATAKTATRKKT